MRLLTALLCLLLVSTGFGQSDFAMLPAKVKTEMAEEEEQLSELDEAFQTMMSEGMDHFEAGRYEEALSNFESARQRRPLNVYPPVMIEDVKLSMELDKAEEVTKEPIEEAPEPPTPEMTADERVALMYEAEMRKVRGDMPPPPKEEMPKDTKPPLVKDKEGLIVESPQELPMDSSKQAREKPVLHIETVSEKVAELTPEPKAQTKVTVKVKKPDLEVAQETKAIEAEVIERKPKSIPVDGMTERTYQEGNKTVTECVLTENGESTTYRMVKHAWGGVFYFKGGESITKREWDEDLSQ